MIMGRVMDGRLSGLAGLVALSIVPVSLGAQEVGDPQEGSAFARQVCASCHAVEHGQALSPNPKAPTFDRIAGTPGMTQTALYVFLRTPHRAMPDLILDAHEIRNVVSYILSLKDHR
jgi:mono/diheme cytochrome c family protein